METHAVHARVARRDVQICRSCLRRVIATASVWFMASIFSRMVVLAHDRRPDVKGDRGAESVSAGRVAPTSKRPNRLSPIAFRTTTASATTAEMSPIRSLKAKGGRIQRLPASSIKTGDGRIANFKDGANPSTGIVPGNELEGEYDERTVGLPVVMRFEGGHYETVMGRHRINLAQRQGLEVNVMVLEHGEDGAPGTVSIAEVVLNELSPRRRELLAQLGLAPKVYGFNAENLWVLFYPLVGNGSRLFPLHCAT